MVVNVAVDRQLLTIAKGVQKRLDLSSHLQANLRAKAGRTRTAKSLRPQAGETPTESPAVVYQKIHLRRV